jgi:hypothetical protein
MVWAIQLQGTVTDVSKHKLCQLPLLLSAAFAVGFGGWIFTYATKQAGLSEHEGHSVNAAYW